MGSYSIDIKSPYGTETYDDIKNTYLWIYSILKKTECSEFVSQFSYNIGEIRCQSNSFEEFQNEAFGQEIKFSRATFSAFFDDEKHIHFDIMPQYHSKDDKNVSISCDSRIDLSRILDIIKEIENEANNPQSATIQNIQNHYGDKIEFTGNTTVIESNIGGHNNSTNDNNIKIIDNTSNNIVSHNNTDNGDKRKGSIVKDIFINILSNWIWWIIGTIIIVVIGVATAMNWEEIINFIMGR